MKKFEAKSIKKTDKQVQILGVKVTGTELVEVLNIIGKYLVNKHKFLIVTPNPENLLKTLDDKDYREILNRADISIPDGIGLAWLTGLKVIHGRELFVEILRLLSKSRGRVYLLGAPEGEKAAIRVAKEYPDLEVRGQNGPWLDDEGDPVSKEDREIELSILEDINKFRPDMLCVGFGAPKQEKWVVKNWKELQVGGIIAFGRTLEFFSGKYPLPPKWLERLELEWLWRLLTGSTNIKRIWRAVVVFPWKVLLYRLSPTR